MASNLPYVITLAGLKTALEKIIEAATPARFTQDFLATKLGLTSGAAKSVIPYLKKIGFLGTDGTPTETYKQFRNPSERGAASARALKQGYSKLYESNEYAHELSDQKLKGLLVQLTGQEEKSQVISKTIGSFKILKEYASFDKQSDAIIEHVEEPDDTSTENTQAQFQQINNANEEVGLNLSYTINLNLPATSDIAVFNAIFKSLKDNLLKK